MAKTKQTTMEFEAEIVEEAPLAPDEIGAPIPQGTKLQDAMASLWATSGPEPQVELPPSPAVVLPPLPPLLPLAEKVEQPEVKYLKDFTIYDRKAQWFGNPPREDEPYFQVLCVGQRCRKPTWTRAQREDVCEECYQVIQFRLEEDAHHARKFAEQRTYSGLIGWYNE